MTPIRPKLKKGDISLKEIYLLSKKLYRSNLVDDKKHRMELDIKTAKMTVIKNFTFDATAKGWKQEGKRHIKFEFLVKSVPISYQKIDTLKVHFYVVTFLFYDLEGMGINSPFRWRTGSLKKPLLKKRSKSTSELANYNIKRGIQLQFFFNLMVVLSKFGLLYGPDTTNHQLPRKTNPKLLPYFDKHSLFIVEKIFFPLLTSSNKDKFLKRIQPYLGTN
jgi:hypothetical protein